MDTLAHAEAVVEQLDQIIEDNGCSGDAYCDMLDLLAESPPNIVWSDENDLAQRLHRLLVAMIDAVPDWAFDAVVVRDVACRLVAALSP